METPDFTEETIAYAREMRVLYRAAEQRAVRFRLLVEMGRDLVSARDSGALLEVALNRSITFSGYAGGCVLLLASDSALAVRASVGLGTRMSEVSWCEGVWAEAHRALARGEPLILSTLTDEARLRVLARRESRIYLPLLPSDGQVIGVLMLTGNGETLPPDADDLDALQLLAGQVAAALQSTQLHEENGRLVGRLVEREHRLAELIDRLLRAQEEERRRIAYEVHDGLAQMALGVLQQLHTLADRYKPRAVRSAQALSRAVEMAQATVTEARRVIAGLRPTVLDDFGLATALRILTVTLQSEGWEVSFEEDTGTTRLPPSLEAVLYRIAQELLTNVRKHAGPSQVRLALCRSDDKVQLVVQDWGQGFEPGQQEGPSSTGEHMGLAGVQERVSLVGGQWRIVSRPGQGTLVEVSIPLPLPTQGAT